MSMCLCACVLPCNLGECFISLLVEPIAGKNVSPSDKNLWRFSKNVLVAKQLQCNALSIGRHLKFLRFCLC